MAADLELLASIGNIRSNSLWMPITALSETEGSSAPYKLTSRATRDVRQRFIVDKYARKKYVVEAARSAATGSAEEEQVIDHGKALLCAAVVSGNLLDALRALISLRPVPVDVGAADASVVANSSSSSSTTIAATAATATRSTQSSSVQFIDRAISTALRLGALHQQALCVELLCLWASATTLE